MEDVQVAAYHFSHQGLSWQMTERQQCDVELVLDGGFYPLVGFLNQADYQAVLNEMRLKSDSLWPIPITLDIPFKLAEQISLGDVLLLKDKQGNHRAVLKVESIWEADKAMEAEAIYETLDKHHSGVRTLLESTCPVYVGGTLTRIGEEACGFDALRFLYSEHYQTPWQLKQQFKALGWERIVAFQTRNPLHRAHYELTQAAMREYNAKLLLQPVVGQTAPGDIDAATRIRCYQALLPYYPKDSVKLSLLPLAMRMAGPREALWHALIRQNYGATHFIIGRDHAGPGKDAQGQVFYPPEAAAELVKSYQEELNIQAVTFDEYVYLPSVQRYASIVTAKSMELVHQSLSGTEVRKKLQAKQALPGWYSFNEVLAELQKAYSSQPRGFTVFFTGLSGAGKSTLAQALKGVLEALGRKVTLLDGDEVCQHLSSELGFSKAHRDLNILRLGYVAREITYHGGIAIIAAIAPYQSTRQQVRKMIAPFGGFIEVHLSTPLSTCEARDVKGLYAKARQGELKHFTGLDDPYEAPKEPELTLDTTHTTLQSSLAQLLERLTKLDAISRQTISASHLEVSSHEMVQKEQETANA